MGLSENKGRVNTLIMETFDYKFRIVCSLTILEEGNMKQIEQTLIQDINASNDVSAAILSGMNAHKELVEKYGDNLLSLDIIDNKCGFVKPTPHNNK